MLIISLLDRAARSGAFAAAQLSSASANAQTALTLLREELRSRAELTPAPYDPASPAPAGTLTELETARCMELLRTRRIGRLAYLTHGHVPDMAVVNYAVLEGDILIRTGPGSKLRNTSEGDPVAFEVDCLDEQAHSGWSVVVVAQAVRILPSELAEFAPERLPQPWASGPRDIYLRLRPTRITGRDLA